MKRRKIIPDPVLMMVSILGITAFLIYWLTENYEREKKSLTIKTESAFRETIRHLQAAKLKLDGFSQDSSDSDNVRVFVSNGEAGPVKLRFKPKEEIVSTINVIRDKLKDSLKKMPGDGKRMIISMNTTSLSTEDGSVRVNKIIPRPGPGHDQIFNLLYGVDSLQDSIKVNEISSAYSRELKRQKLAVPFDVKRLDSSSTSDERAFNEVSVGFAKPITYRLELGNTFPYLIRRISMPVIFSVLLLGITILSFVLLYKNALKQRRLADLKNEFISNITHELKTPIATVGVAIEALKNFNAMQNPERTKEYLDISSNELQRLGMLVDKVLKLSMFEKKEIELRYETFNLKEVADEVLASLRLQLEKYHAKIEMTNEGDLNMQGDRLHMQSVIFNLLDNALKYSKDEPSIRVTMQERDNAIVLSVADNGIGIPAEYKDKVFDKFFRIPHGDTHNAKGYGLGLSYAAQVIIKHNGTIAVESEPGSGTKFIITLPKQQV